MTNLDGLERSSIEARIEYLINQRMKEHGESREFAEVQVTRTEEGRALWSRSREMRLSESSAEPRSSSFSRGTVSLIVEQAKLDNLIAMRMSDQGETFEAAERAVIHTAEGLELWETVRKLRFTES